MKKYMLELFFIFVALVASTGNALGDSWDYLKEGLTPAARPKNFPAVPAGSTAHPSLRSSYYGKHFIDFYLAENHLYIEIFPDGDVRQRVTLQVRNSDTFWELIRSRNVEVRGFSIRDSRLVPADQTRDLPPPFPILMYIRGFMDNQIRIFRWNRPDQAIIWAG